MSSSPSNSPQDTAGTPRTPPPRVPDHELLRCIGRGAYGEVWLARSVTGAYRAVKIVHRRNFEHDRPFEREFEGILKFEPVSRRHDSQVDILHVGRGDDHFYYVMELADDQATGGQIPAPDLYKPRTVKSDLVFRGRLPFEECVQIGIALTTALEHLHANGLVHRDVKPSNIIFVNGVPKLADIGLVTSLDATRSHVGTEGFAAPEGPGSPQADFYSLGKVLYEIATGKDRQEFPELPTQLRELPDREGLIELNAVIAKACRHDPKDRYRSAVAMRADLEVLQSGKSLARLHRLEKRLRFVTRAGAAVAGLAALIAGGWFYQHSQTREARQLAEQNRQLASEKSRLADETSRLAEENRARLVRLDIANGVRLLDEGDTAGALLWFAEALPLVANNAAETSIHRIRIQQTLDEIPRLLQLLPHESSVLVGVFSPDGRRIATGTEAGRVRVWDASSGTPLWPPREMGLPALQMRFSRDGRRLFVSSSVRQDCAAQGRAPVNFAAVLDVETGKEMFPTMLSNVEWATFSPDDRWLAVADFKNVIRIHDASNGRLVTELKGHTRDILMPSFSADGSVFASASRDRTARLWRLPSGEPLGPPLQHSAPVARAILSADGRRLATSTEPLKANGECLIQTWDTPNGEKIGGHLHVTNAAYALFFNDRGDRLFTGGNEPRVRMWNAEEHTEALRLLEMKGVASSWALSPDGSRVAVGSDDHAARIWSLETGELLFPPFRHTAWVMSVQFSPHGTCLLTTGNDGTARLWDLSFRHEAAAVRLDAPIIKEPANYFDANLGRQNGPFPVSLSDGSVRLIDAERLQEVHRLVPGGKEQPPDRCLAAPDGKQWAVYRWSRELLQPPQALDLWREEQGELRHFVLQHPQRVQSVAFSADGARLYTGCNDGNVRIWRTADGVVERTIKLPQVYPYVWGFRPDLRLALLYLYQTNALEVFDLESGKTVGSRFMVPAMQDWGLDPQGARIGTVSQDSYARIFDARTGKLTIPPLKHPDSVFWFDWTADGQRIVTAGDGPQALMWETATGEFLAAPLKTGTQSTRAARWSADGRFVVTRSDDNFVRVWDAATAEPITPLLRHAGYIRFACITANRRLLTGTDPNVLRAWDLKETSLPGEVLANYAKVLSGRRLNATGVSLPLKAEELAELYRSLQKRAPELFK